jgi:hypothetical protein
LPRLAAALRAPFFAASVARGAFTVRFAAAFLPPRAAALRAGAFFATFFAPRAGFAAAFFAATFLTGLTGRRAVLRSLRSPSIPETTALDAAFAISVAVATTFSTAPATAVCTWPAASCTVVAGVGGVPPVVGFCSFWFSMVCLLVETVSEFEIIARCASSLCFFSRSSASRARSFSTTSGGAFATKLGFSSFLPTEARSWSNFAISLSIRVDSAARSIAPARPTRTSKPAPTATALSLRFAGAAPSESTRATFTLESRCTRPSSSRTVAAASGASDPISTSSRTTLNGTFISPRMFRIASTIPITGPKPRSAASSTSPARG